MTQVQLSAVTIFSTVFVDIEQNPGPLIALGFKCAENFGNFDLPTPNVWSKINYS